MKYVGEISERVPQITMLVGLPGSGKSTIAEEFSKMCGGIDIFSSDKLREELFGDVDTQDKNDEVFKELHKRIKDTLLEGKDCIYDATNIQGKYRKAFLNELNGIKCCKAVAVVAVPYDLCLDRNRQRDRKVPEEVIRRMYLNFQPPFYHEGWDSVQIWTPYDMPPEKSMLRYLLSKMESFDQKNDHHTLTLGDHCRKCAEYVQKHFVREIFPEDKLLYEAARIHDCGKIFTQSRLNGKGEDDGNYHYYQHHCVGAYDSILIMKNEGYCDHDVMYISNLIYYHMHPFLSWDKSEKAKKRDSEYIGQKMFIDVLCLHEGDLYAH